MGFSQDEKGCAGLFTLGIFCWACVGAFGFGVHDLLCEHPLRGSMLVIGAAGGAWLVGYVMERGGRR